MEMFLVLLRRVDEASRMPSPTPMGAWLRQIARRVAANQHRGDRRRTRKHDELRADADTMAGDAMDPQERYARAEAWAFVREFLESLDSEACAVFVMSEIEGLRGAEIAERLRLSPPIWDGRESTSVGGGAVGWRGFDRYGCSGFGDAKSSSAAGVSRLRERERAVSRSTEPVHELLSTHSIHWRS